MKSFFKVHAFAYTQQQFLDYGSPEASNINIGAQSLKTKLPTLVIFLTTTLAKAHQLIGKSLKSLICKKTIFTIMPTLHIKISKILLHI